MCHIVHNIQRTNQALSSACVYLKKLDPEGKPKSFDIWGSLKMRKNMWAVFQNPGCLGYIGDIYYPVI